MQKLKMPQLIILLLLITGHFCLTAGWMIIPNYTMENEGTFAPKENLMVPFYANTIHVHVLFKVQMKSLRISAVLKVKRKIGKKARIWETGCLHQLLWHETQVNHKIDWVPKKMPSNKIKFKKQRFSKISNTVTVQLRYTQTIHV